MPKPVLELPESQIKPDLKLEKRTRRKFSGSYKLQIITEANSCKYGELGALLRRENLYSNQLVEWRREYAEHGLSGLQKSTPGPLSSKTPEQREITQLNKDNQKLRRQLEIATDCLDLQKKALSMLDHMHNGNNA